MAERWNGRRWSLVNVDVNVNVPACNSSAFPDGFTDVSCASRSFCMALDSNENFATWDGTSWLGQAVPQLSAFPFFSISAVSCPARDACAEVGSDPGQNVVGWWNGHDWKLDGLNDDTRFGPSIASLSCPSIKFCTAVGAGGGDGESNSETVAWNGSRWGSPSYPSQLTAPLVVSCVSRAECVAVNVSVATLTGTSVATFNGRGWTKTASAFHAYPNAISCPAAGWCMVVGYLFNPRNGLPLTPAAASVK